MAYTKEKRIFNQMRGATDKDKNKTNNTYEIAGDIPNYSGDHSAGKVYNTPINDYDIVNKKYVDDNGVTNYLRDDANDETTGELTADKFIVSDTDFSSKTNFDSTINVTVTGNDFGSTYYGYEADVDYTLNSGKFSNSSPIAYYGDVKTTLTGSDLGMTTSIFGGKLNSGGATAPALKSDIAGVNVSVGDSNTATIYGAYTQASNAGTGLTYGYEGYGANTSAGTGFNSVGVRGYAQSSNGLAAGLYGLPFGVSTKKFGLYIQGNSHFYDGMLQIYNNTAIQTAPAKTHLSAGQKGTLWVESDTEIDGTLYADGDVVGRQDLTQGDGGSGKLYMKSVNTPSQITSDQDDYDVGDYTIIRLNTDASRNITGFSGGTDGRMILIINVGSNNLILQNQDANSTAANRLIIGTSEAVVGTNDSRWFWYDATDSRWRHISSNEA